MNNENLVDELNQLLSDFHIYYQNVRGFHWNIKGSNFFELHAKFEELYTEALVNIDEIAERILTIGGEPLHTFEDYQNRSSLKVYAGIHHDEATVNALLEQLQALIKQEGRVKAISTRADDHETEDMMIGLVNAQQKTSWMFRSWLGQ